MYIYIYILYIYTRKLQYPFTAYRGTLSQARSRMTAKSARSRRAEFVRFTRSPITQSAQDERQLVPVGQLPDLPVLRGVNLAQATASLDLALRQTQVRAQQREEKAKERLEKAERKGSGRGKGRGKAGKQAKDAHAAANAQAETPPAAAASEVPAVLRDAQTEMPQAAASANGQAETPHAQAASAEAAVPPAEASAEAAVPLTVEQAETPQAPAASAEAAVPPTDASAEAAVPPAKGQAETPQAPAASAKAGVRKTKRQADTQPGELVTPNPKLRRTSNSTASLDEPPSQSKVEHPQAPFVSQAIATHDVLPLLGSGTPRAGRS